MHLLPDGKSTPGSQLLLLFLVQHHNHVPVLLVLERGQEEGVKDEGLVYFTVSLYHIGLKVFSF